MKKILFLFLLFFNLVLHAQDKLFQVYTDSATLVKDANNLVNGFVQQVNMIKPVFVSQPVAILNTQPFLIFYSAKANKINLPMWQQVIEQQKDFFYEIAGNKTAGAKIFGLFFNGFYLPHELGHALQNVSGKKDRQSIYE